MQAIVVAERVRWTAATIGVLMIAAGMELAFADGMMGMSVLLSGPAVGLTIIAAAHWWLCGERFWPYAIFLGALWLGVGLFMSIPHGGACMLSLTW